MFNLFIRRIGATSGLPIALCIVVALGATGCQRQAALSPQGPVTPATEPPTQVTQQNTAPQADPTWFACQADTDCVVVPGVCMEHSAVNTRFQAEYEKFRDAMQPMVRCAPIQQPAKAPQAVCLQHRCGLKDNGAL